MMIDYLNVVLVSLIITSAVGVVWLDFGVGGVDACCGACATLGFSALLDLTLGFAEMLVGGRLE